MYNKVGLADVMEAFEREKIKFSPAQKVNVNIHLHYF